jgi:hypothetical protein
MSLWKISCIPVAGCRDSIDPIENIVLHHVQYRPLRPTAMVATALLMRLPVLLHDRTRKLEILHVAVRHKVGLEVRFPIAVDIAEVREALVVPQVRCAVPVGQSAVTFSSMEETRRTSSIGSCSIPSCCCRCAVGAPGSGSARPK